MNKYVIGVDFGTDSCRALIVDAQTGEEVAASVKYYPRWSEGKYCNPSLNRYRQHPLDYIETLEWAIREAISKSPSGIAEQITGIGFDTTGSTPALTDASGTPLALSDEFSENPNAMFVLWKDHVAVTEAAEINELAKKWHTDYTACEGGIYSSEWVWAKVSQITPGVLVKAIGTSTCDIMVAACEDIGKKLIPGICGQVDGSVIPNMIGLEAGQSAFGDIFAWFRQIMEWPVKHILEKSESITHIEKEELIKKTFKRIIPSLAEEARKIPMNESVVIATDWFNGRRTPDADQLLTATITGLSLGTSAPSIFRALVEAAAFGSKAIIDRFVENGINIRDVIGIGGISYKAPFVMQTMADVIGIPVNVSASEQCCALGAAMFAAVAAGVHPDVEAAQKAMGRGFITTYHPDTEKHREYLNRYEKYKSIAEFTGKTES